MEEQTVVNIDDYGFFPFSTSWSLFLKPPADSATADYVVIYPERRDGSQSGNEPKPGGNIDHSDQTSLLRTERPTLLLTKIPDIKTFWQSYRTLPPPSQLRSEADYLLFRDGVSPFSEDPTNDHGGKWTLQLPANKTDSKIDTLWLNMLMSAVGEVFDEACLSEQNCLDLTDLVNGVSIAVRHSFFLLSIWVKPQSEGFFESDRGVNMIRQLGIAFKTNVLGYPSGHQFTFGNHGYTTEVEFHRHIKGKSKKALKRTKIIV